MTTPTAVGRGARRWLSARVGALDRRLDDVGHVRALAVLRIALGPIVWLHLRPFTTALDRGRIWSDTFNEPWVSWYPEPGRAASTVLLWTALVAAMALSIGLLTRLAAWTTTAVVVHNLFLSTTHYSHNRAFLCILLVTVALLPVGDHLSVDAWRRRRVDPGWEPSPTPLWPLYLARLEVASVYLASGTSKLVDQDWWSGRVLLLRAVDERQLALDNGAPIWLMDLLADPTFQWWAAKVIVATELVIGLGLLVRRTRLVAIWCAIPFHVGIQIGASVQVFSWAALAALALWVRPTWQDRTVWLPTNRSARWVRALDWYGRFRIEVGVPHRLADRDTPRLVQPGASGVGTPSPPVAGRGDHGRLELWSRLPATAWFALPALAIARRRGGPQA